MQRRTGSLFDVPVILVLVFSIALSAIFAHLIIDKIIQNTTDDQIDQETLKEAKSAIEIYDYGILLINGGLYLAAIVFAFMIPSSPLFFIPALFFTVIATWLSAEISNIFNEIIHVDAVTDSANQFPNMITFFEKQPIIVGFFILVLVIALYAKIDLGRREVGV